MSYSPQERQPRPRLPLALSVLIWLIIGLIVASILFVVLFVVAIG